tara:strand:+ start:335 stop:484 length:150 start_codon:yes stop_codon:yes gene_type:complete
MVILVIIGTFVFGVLCGMYWQDVLDKVWGKKKPTTYKAAVFNKRIKNER